MQTWPGKAYPLGATYDGTGVNVAVFSEVATGNGQAIPEPDRRAQKIVDDDFLMIFNASDHEIPFVLPDVTYGAAWVVEIDTSGSKPRRRPHRAGAEVVAPERSVVDLRPPRTVSPIGVRA